MDSRRNACNYPRVSIQLLLRFYPSRKYRKTRKKCFNTTLVKVLFIVILRHSRMIPVSIQLLLRFYCGTCRKRIFFYKVSIQLLLRFYLLAISSFISFSCVSIQLLLRFYQEQRNLKQNQKGFNTTLVKVLCVPGNNTDMEVR